MKHGFFIISLDFELFWGVTGTKTIDNYGENLKNKEMVVPKLLHLFEKYSISATWATVGFLLFKDKKSLLPYLPENKPGYLNKRLSSYEVLSEFNDEDPDRKCYFNYEIVSQLLNHPSQEFASQTFSHLYAIENGITEKDFITDTLIYDEIAKARGIKLKSFVFPRNQVRLNSLQVLKDHGYLCYRGNEANFLYNKRSNIYRFLRLIDSYFSFFGSHSFIPKINSGLVNIPHSLILRPYSQFWFLNWLQLERLKKAMKSAAIHNRAFHIYWHPHNFGKNIEENIHQLEKILQYYQYLSKKYNYQNINMGDLAAKVIKNEV